jgi:hypothetical protein
VNNAPVSIIQALESDDFEYANLIKINLGDAYDDGNNFILYYTDHRNELTYDGNTYTPNNHLTELEGISRKAETGSDKVDISFGVTDLDIIDAIRAERYINKPTEIMRVIVVNGVVFEDYAIPVRTAWGLSHSIEGGLQDRFITLTIDSALGDLETDNGWYVLNSSHQERHPNDLIMNWASTVFTDEQKTRYISNPSGVITQDVKPPSLPVIYGYKNVTPVPILRLQHRKSRTSYRHYFTTWIYVVGIGQLTNVDVANLRKGAEKVDMTNVTGNSTDVGGWSYRVLSPSENNTAIKTNSKLNFWREGMDTNERNRLNGMFGKGLTLLFVKNRNRDDWVQSNPEFTVPVLGKDVYDPRVGTGPQANQNYLRNPALQYYDFLRSTDYGAGNRNVSVSEENITTLANHFDNLPGSDGNPGINSIKFDVQLDTGKPLTDNMSIWIEGARLYTSDYYGEFLVRAETITAPAYTFTEDDLEGDPDYSSGDFTDKITRLTYKVKQLVPDTSEDAETGDLIEVDVEATFPPINSGIYNSWLAEDGGIENFESEQLEYVTELQQGFFWAMVDARVSRQPRTLTLPVGPIGWLLEAGDVIEYSSNISKHDESLWRIVELKENDNGGIDLDCIGYADEFYSPDPNVIPDPTPFAKPPTQDKLIAVVGFEILNIQDNYYLNFEPLVDANVSYYAVEIENTEEPGVIVYNEPKLSFPPLLLTDIITGSYTSRIVAIGIGNEGTEGNYSFDIDALVTPTVAPNVSDVVPGRIVVEPPTPLFQSRTYEWRYYTSESSTVVYWGDAKIFNLSPIIEDVTYFIEYRLKSLINGVTRGEWVDIQINGVEQVFYTWVAYADDENGTNPSLSPSGKAFYGIATARTSSTILITADYLPFYQWIAQPDVGDGAEGAPALSGVLTSESHTLPATNDGTVLSYTGAETTFKIYLGAVDDTAAWNVSATTSNGVAGVLTGTTFTITNLGVDNAFVDLTATRLDYPSITKRFSVSKTKNGFSPVIYQIRYPEGLALKENGNQSVSLDIIKIESGSITTVVNGSIKLYDGNTDLGYSQSYNRSQVDNSKTIQLKDGSLVVDAVTIVDVADGDDGTDALYWSIENTNGLVFLKDKDGNYTPSQTSTQVTGTLYRGGAEIATRSFTANRSGNGDYFGVSNFTATGEVTTSSSATGSGTNVVRFKFRHNSSGVEVTESVVLSVDGINGEDGYSPIKGTDYDDGIDGNNVRVEYSANGTTGWTVTFNSTHKYIRSSVDTNGDGNYTPGNAAKFIPELGVEYSVTDGISSYLHIKYSNNGTTFTANNGETLGTYIGTYVDNTEEDSNTFSDYTFRKYIGDNGKDGVYGSIACNQGTTWKVDQDGVYTPSSATKLSCVCTFYKDGATVATRTRNIVVVPSTGKLTREEVGSPNGISAGESDYESTRTFTFTYEGVTVSQVFSILFDGERGVSPLFYQIRYPQGLALKENGNQNVSLDIIKIESGSITTVSSGSIKLYDGNTDLGYSQSYNRAQVNNSKTIQLKDGSLVVDAVTIVDVADGNPGANAVYGFIENNNGLIYTKDKDSNYVPTATNTTLTGKFYRGGSLVAQRAITVYRQTNDTFTTAIGNDTGTESTSETSVFGSGTRNVTVNFRHNISNVTVSESVILTIDGPEGPEGPEGPTGPKGNDGQASSDQYDDSDAYTGNGFSFSGWVEVYAFTVPPNLGNFQISNTLAISGRAFKNNFGGGGPGNSGDEIECRMRLEVKCVAPAPSGASLGYKASDRGVPVTNPTALHDFTTTRPSGRYSVQIKKTGYDGATNTSWSWSGGWSIKR